MKSQVDWIKLKNKHENIQSAKKETNWKLFIYFVTGLSNNCFRHDFIHGTSIETSRFVCFFVAYILEAIDEMWKATLRQLREEGAYCIRTFFVGPKGRSLKEMLALGKSIQNSLATEQDAYRDGAPNAKKPTRTALHFGAARARRGQVLFDTRSGRSSRRLLSAQE